MRRSIVPAALLLGCGHSDPFVTTIDPAESAFNAATPVRLTYSPRTDEDPGFSDDGTTITYSFEQQTSFDRCIGFLPVTGGTLLGQLCAPNPAPGTFKVGLAQAALRDDGIVAFTRHDGKIGNLTSDGLGLWVGPRDAIDQATRAMGLGTQPAGANGRWDDLLTPAWVGDQELLALAVRRHLVNASACGSCPPPRDPERVPLRDTIPIGVEFARLRIANGAATVLATIPASDAIAWALDRESNQLSYVVQRPRPDLAEIYHESLADSVYTVPLSGGIPQLRYGTSGLDGAPLERIHGVAAGHGRLFISRSYRPDLPPGPVVPDGTPLSSDISEVLPDGSLRLVAPQLGWHWGKIRLSPDGQWLVAEALERTTADLYLIRVGS